MLSAESTVSVNKKTGQMVICIPSKMAVDSQFDFKAGDRVEIVYLPKGRHVSQVPTLVIWKLRKKKQ